MSETARQVASLPVSSLPVPYDQMMNQCEALMNGKQQKMSVLRSFKPEAAKAITFSEEDEKEEVFLLKEVRESLFLCSVDINYPPINFLVFILCVADRRS